MKWVEKYNIKSVMYIWQGGQDGGKAVADLLSGDATPCGKLTDTIARDIYLYPGVKNFGNKDNNVYEEDIYVGYRYFETFAKEDVLYPFGFGLSYTNFEKKVLAAYQKDDEIKIDVEVKNTGNFSGREIIEVYFEAPQGLLGKSVRQLCAFKKTRLLAINETETLSFNIRIKDMCCYDDSGITGYKSCYILEKGNYNIYLGSCVRCAEKIFQYNVPDTYVVKQCTEVLAPVRAFEIMHPEYNDGKYEVRYKGVSQRTIDYRERIEQNIPSEITYVGNTGIKLSDVKTGKNTMEEFVAQLSDKELAYLVHGEGMCSPKVRPGGAGAIGGLTKELFEYGIPIVALHDGPSGIRMDSGEKATSIPNGTAIACTWNEELAQKLYSALSIELYTHNIDSILGPGINIHRTPLNGRNFEYFSEDPYISGKMGAALIRGVDEYNNSATLKHFAANSQEFCRRDVDSVMSERAAREIYLKSFEYAVLEGKPTSIMTAYNPINGIWCANNYELNTCILREEWNFDGMVMTDWWPKLSLEEKEYVNLKNLVEAQNDVYMVVSDVTEFKDNIREALENGEITRGQLQRNAINILEYILNSNALNRFESYDGVLNQSLKKMKDELITVTHIKSPISNKNYEIELDKTGRHLIEIKYFSNEPSVAQMTISFKINGKIADAITVNGTDGEENIAYCEILFAHKKSDILLSYPDKQVEVVEIKLKSLN